MDLNNRAPQTTCPNAARSRIPNYDISNDNEELDLSKDESEILVKSIDSLHPMSRNELMESLGYLAKQIELRLADEKRVNKREATRLWISTGPSRSNPCDIHQFIIKRPRDWLTWNQGSAIDIEIQLLKRVVLITERFQWFKLRAHLDAFTSEENVIEAEKIIQSLIEPMGDSHESFRHKKKRRSSSSNRADSKTATPEKKECVTLEDEVEIICVE